jgi:glutamine amidotransferase
VIAICDYGMGNLRSVEKALARVGAEAARVTDPEAVRDADGLILPGVGAFPEAMSRIRGQGFDALIADRSAAGVPVLGICLGMQLIFGSSTELEGADGLRLLEGEVTELDAKGQKVPHIGWAPVSWNRESELTEGLDAEEPFYFVHSLASRPADAADTLGTATYGETFAAVVERDKVFGVQFHPEKSSSAGLRLLENFAAICLPVPA